MAEPSYDAITGNRARKVGAAEAEDLFVNAVVSALECGKAFVVIGEVERPGFVDRLRGTGVEVLVDDKVGESALIVGGETHEWAELREEL